MYSWATRCIFGIKFIRMLPLLHIFAPDMHVQRGGIHNFTAIYILKASSLPNCPRSSEEIEESGNCYTSSVELLTYDQI